MSEIKNVGHLDSMIRLFLGVVCLGSVAYHFLIESLFPIYVLIPVIILIPFFLKTGYTKVCPVMKALDLSTVSNTDIASEDSRDD